MVTRYGRELAPESLPILERVAVTLGQLDGVAAAVDVHHFATGAAKYGREPTGKRAEVIRDYLVSRGVAPGRLVARGRGTDQPIADNKTAEGRRLNTRLEVVLAVPAECAEQLGPGCGQLGP